MIVGEPIWTDAAGAVDADDFLPNATTATPAAAAPATARVIHSHLWLPRGPIRAVELRACGESERYMEQTVPARVCPFAAVIRTSSEPAV